MKYFSLNGSQPSRMSKRIVIPFPKIAALDEMFISRKIYSFLLNFINVLISFFVKIDSAATLGQTRRAVIP